ncbi:MAG TPA: hypothetical protein VFM05_07860 [Candidatus Saccharimonadales bacterium]|nr:hypothetical protein [Candidatus Saccharimonadales bacterium]
MQKAKYAAISVLVVALGILIATFMLPAPNSDPFAFHSLVAVNFVIAVLHIGAAIVFIQGFGGFTTQLKRSYGVLCLGFTLFGLAFGILAASILSGNLDVYLKGVNVAGLLFGASLITLFAGMRSFAHLFSIKNITTSWWFCLVPPAFAVAIYALLSQLSGSPLTENATGPQISFQIFNGWIVGLIFLQIWQVKKIAGVQYTRALAWLLITFGFYLGTSVFDTIFAVFVPPRGNIELLGVIPLLPVIPTGLLLLISAYTFNLITTVTDTALTTFTARTFFGKPLRAKSSEQISSADIVIYAANLVSNPIKIDPLLDQMRIVTANKAPGQDLAPSENETLKHVYLQIEQYLITQEPVRAFTKPILRQTIANNLKLTPGQGTFWDSLPV